MVYALAGSLLALIVMSIFLPSGNAVGACPDTCKQPKGPCPAYCKKNPPNYTPKYSNKKNVIHEAVDTFNKVKKMVGNEVTKAKKSVVNEFHIHGKYRVAPNGASDQLCGGKKQGGPSEKKKCCHVQMYGDGKSWWTPCNKVNNITKCMKDRGCSVKRDVAVNKTNMKAINDHCKGINGGGQNKKCYTDRGVSVCKTTQEQNCWPNGVPCKDFGTYNTHYGKCGTQRQGGSKCKPKCCAAQHAYCKGKSTVDEYFSCMNTKGCMSYATKEVSGGDGCEPMGKRFRFYEKWTDPNFKCGASHQGGPVCKQNCCSDQRKTGTCAVGGCWKDGTMCNLFSKWYKSGGKWHQCPVKFREKWTYYPKNSNCP